MPEHIPDRDLSQYIHDRYALSPERRAEIERHTASCAECGANLQFYTAAEDDLRDPQVWTPEALSPAELLRAYARRCKAEDTAAEELLKPYLENPPKAAWDLIRRREFHTGGVVRRLNARAHGLTENAPLTALTFADLAQAIADILPTNTHPGNAVYELRGTAWKERARALLQLGSYHEALDCLRRAESAYRQLSSPGHGLAGVELVRASVYYQLEEAAKAEHHARLAEQAYEDLGNESRRVRALFLRGSIRLVAHDFDAAAALYSQVIEFGQATHDVVWIAKGSYALANCELDRGSVAKASTLFHTALVIFRETGPVADAIATEWGLARVILHDGNAVEAARRLREVIRSFAELGMVMDATFVSLDLAEALVVLRQGRQVAKIAAHAFQLLTEAGVLTSALTALAYIKEAAANDRLRLDMIQEVRTFLRRTERNPALLFVPPPDTFD